MRALLTAHSAVTSDQSESWPSTLAGLSMSSAVSLRPGLFPARPCRDKGLTALAVWRPPLNSESETSARLARAVAAEEPPTVAAPLNASRNHQHTKRR